MEYSKEYKQNLAMFEQKLEQYQGNSKYQKETQQEIDEMLEEQKLQRMRRILDQKRVDSVPQVVLYQNERFLHRKTTVEKDKSSPSPNNIEQQASSSKIPKQKITQTPLSKQRSFNETSMDSNPYYHSSLINTTPTLKEETNQGESSKNLKSFLRKMIQSEFVHWIAIVLAFVCINYFFKICFEKKI